MGLATHTTSVTRIRLIIPIVRNLEKIDYMKQEAVHLTCISCISCAIRMTLRAYIICGAGWEGVGS